jgi:hypothetical protein
MINPTATPGLGLPNGAMMPQQATQPANMTASSVLANGLTGTPAAANSGQDFFSQVLGDANQQITNLASSADTLIAQIKQKQSLQQPQQAQQGQMSLPQATVPTAATQPVLQNSQVGVPTANLSTPVSVPDFQRIQQASLQIEPTLSTPKKPVNIAVPPGLTAREAWMALNQAFLTKQQQGLIDPRLLMNG